MTGNDPSIRGEYERRGAEEFYRQSGASYRNPHEPQIIDTVAEALRRWKPDLGDVLDLACGSGEITLALRTHGAKKIAGVDPYTSQAYRDRVGLPAEPYSFEQIADGALGGRNYSLIVCSFAMHLCQKSRLPALAWQLSLIAPSLLILTPHKRPTIKADWGWDLQGEFVLKRVRARMHKSTHKSQ
jgi:SAM-dependent methyltransferase